MRFDESRSIFMQIRDYMGDMILNGKYPEGERIPSVRDMAAAMEVNPNTVLRSYGQLQDEQIIHNQRGLGYFVSIGARNRVLASRKENFLRHTLPDVFHSMEVLDIDFHEVREYYDKYKEEHTRPKQSGV
ncbi:GntR family transcriptional regulator [Marispirochaeta aestuarii]|uniref:GntR family transcriptional regulator n=1 Tax=Marispirochaeta aestuarii TaxID=1963862 RepID=UPI0029C96B47|nr:GntR family transcriptional regulator [Marispirochaeta aestuarii]